MLFWKIILLAFFLYILYRFIFGLVLPIYKATRKIKKGFRDMQEKANEQMRQQQAARPNTTQSTESGNGQRPLGEYIEFEEVK